MKYIISVLALCLVLLLGWLVFSTSSLASPRQATQDLFIASPAERDVFEQEQQLLQDDYQQKNQQGSRAIQIFLADGLTTDTSKAAINLDEILDGGPGKDGIPAIDEPTFLSLDEVSVQMPYLLEKESKGIVVEGEGAVKFYPYALLNWHEIVNDELGGTPIAVTFCPLCGSAIVFDRRVDGDVLRFGVSGKLFESNLLMYDDRTETLWSQARGKGVVGAYTDIELKHITSNVISYHEFTSLYPDGLVLSDKTGYPRDYAHAPYGDYDQNDQLLFPVSNTDARLPKKEILYVVNDGGVSIAFVKQDLVKATEASLDVDGILYTASFASGQTRVLRDGEELAGYHEMFFSRATHNPKSKNLWMMSEEEKK